MRVQPSSKNLFRDHRSEFLDPRADRQSPFQITSLHQTILPVQGTVSGLFLLRGENRQSKSNQLAVYYSNNTLSFYDIKDNFNFELTVDLSLMFKGFIISR